MHKNKYVVADALFIAAALAALVEPNVCDSRLGETTSGRPGERSPTKALDVVGRHSLRHHRDLHIVRDPPLCRARLPPRRARRRRQPAARAFEPAAGRDGIGLWRLHTRAVRDAFRNLTTCA